MNPTTLRRATLLALLVGPLACAPKPAPPAAPVEAPAAPTAPALAPTRLGAPPPLAERPFTIPAAREGRLANGVPVYLVENHEVPIVSVSLRFRTDGDADPAKKEGVRSLTAELMGRGAGNLDAEAFDRRVRALGAELNVWATDTDVSVRTTSLKRNLGPTLELARLVLTEPRFDKSEWELVLQQSKDAVLARHENATTTAFTVLDRVVHGDRYLGRVVTEASLARVTVADLKAFRQRWITTKNLAVYVGGDTTLEEVLPLLEGAFGKLPAGAAGVGAEPAPPTATGPTITLVDRPGAAQAVITAATYVGRPTDPDYQALTVANLAWGGQFTARLNMNLREQKGYTYGANSRVEYTLAGTRFELSTSVQSDKAVPAFQEILAELAGPTSGRPFTDQEIADAKSAVLQSLPLQFELPETLLGRVRDIGTYGLPADWVTGLPARVAKVTTADAQAAWEQNLAKAPLRFVVVGDAASLRGPLGQLGLPLDERDADGAPKR